MLALICFASVILSTAALPVTSLLTKRAGSQSSVKGRASVSQRVVVDSKGAGDADGHAYYGDGDSYYGDEDAGDGYYSDADGDAFYGDSGNYYGDGDSGDGGADGDGYSYGDASADGDGDYGYGDYGGAYGDSGDGDGDVGDGDGSYGDAYGDFGDSGDAYGDFGDGDSGDGYGDGVQQGYGDGYGSSGDSSAATGIGGLGTVGWRWKGRWIAWGSRWNQVRRMRWYRAWVKWRISYAKWRQKVARRAAYANAYAKWRQKMAGAKRRASANPYYSTFTGGANSASRSNRYITRKMEPGQQQQQGEPSQVSIDVTVNKGRRGRKHVLRDRHSGGNPPSSGVVLQKFLT